MKQTDISKAKNPGSLNSGMAIAEAKVFLFFKKIEQFLFFLFEFRPRVSTALNCPEHWRIGMCCEAEEEKEMEERKVGTLVTSISSSVSIPNQSFCYGVFLTSIITEGYII